MNQNYQEVPKIISCKDLDYLSDMFSWNSGAYKKAVNFSSNVQDMEVKDMLDKASNTFYNTLTTILNILNDGGNTNE